MCTLYCFFPIIYYLFALHWIGLTGRNWIEICSEADASHARRLLHASLCVKFLGADGGRGPFVDYARLATRINGAAAAKAVDLEERRTKYAALFAAAASFCSSSYDNKENAESDGSNGDAKKKQLLHSALMDALWSQVHTLTSALEASTALSAAGQGLSPLPSPFSNSLHQILTLYIGISSHFFVFSFF